MIVTSPDNSQKKSDMENLFSIAGIYFKNIKENEDKVVRTLKSYTDDGWKADHVTYAQPERQRFRRYFYDKVFVSEAG